MALFFLGFFRKQLIDVIERVDDDRSTIVYRFPTEDREIQNGAKLVVREGQAAVLVHNGQFADVFGPGLHTLSTENLPVLTNLLHWHTGFKSPFKSEVYFISLRQFADLKWGTPNPVMMRDAEFGMVRLRGFGAYAIRVSDVRSFLTEVVGTAMRIRMEEIQDYLRRIVAQSFADAVAEVGIPALDLAARYDELAATTRRRLQPAFAGFGLELADFRIENISLPPEVEKAIDERSKLGVMGGHLDALTRLKAAEALGASGGVGGGSTMGQAAAQAMGLAMGLRMAGEMGGAAGGMATSTGTTAAGGGAAFTGVGVTTAPRMGHATPAVGMLPNPVDTPADSGTGAGTSPCNACQSPVPTGSKFCPECGAARGPQPCPQCGVAVDPRAKFCPECGAKRG